MDMYQQNEVAAILRTSRPEGGTSPLRIALNEWACTRLDQQARQVDELWK